MASAAAAPQMAGCWVLFGIGRQHHTNDLRFVQETFGNNGRTGRSISRQVSVSFSDMRPSRLMKRGELAGGVGVLAIVHGEREKSGSRLACSAYKR